MFEARREHDGGVQVKAETLPGIQPSEEGTRPRER